MEKLTEVTVATDTAVKLALAVTRLPLDLCCNCGASDDLTLVPTPMPVADLAGEDAVQLRIPHCKRCLRTARRPPPRWGRTLTFVPFFFVLAALAVAAAMTLIGRPLDQGNMPVALAVITLLSVVAPSLLFRWRPPETAEQTSRYQAVRLRLKKSFLGKVEEITFAFTNPTYAERYRGTPADP